MRRCHELQTSAQERRVSTPFTYERTTLNTSMGTRALNGTVVIVDVDVWNNEGIMNSCRADLKGVPGRMGKKEVHGW